MQLELHCHSTRSDGDLDPSRLGAWARELELEVFCLSDHDTLSGCAEAEAAYGPEPGRVFVWGLELSCRHEGRTVHLLIYLPDDGPAAADALGERLEGLRVGRVHRFRAMVARMNELGVAVEAPEDLDERPGWSPGRPELAKRLVEMGAANSVRAAFDRWLGDQRPAYIPSEGPSLREGLAWGRELGAKMSLAHPQVFRHHAFVASLYADFQEQGLEGIELWTGPSASTTRRRYESLARERGLVVTGGSDFHGTAHAVVDRPGIRIEGAEGERLRAWLGA